MKIILLALGISTIPAFPQARAPINQQSGNCSLNFSGNNNTGSVTCTGIDKQLAENIRDIVNSTRGNAKALKDISAKLDAIKKEVERAAPSQNGTTITVPISVESGSAFSIGQQGGQTAGTIINNGPLERHLTGPQTERLDAVADMLPESASTWFEVESTYDSESSAFAKEIFDVFSAKHKVKPNGPVTRLVESNPSLRGVFVVVGSPTDEHFKEAERIAKALDRPDTPVNFGPAKDLPHGVVKIIILRAEPKQPTAQDRKKQR